MKYLVNFGIDGLIRAVHVRDILIICHRCNTRRSRRWIRSRFVQCFAESGLANGRHRAVCYGWYRITWFGFCRWLRRLLYTIIFPLSRSIHSQQGCIDYIFGQGLWIYGNGWAQRWRTAVNNGCYLGIRVSFCSKIYMIIVRRQTVYCIRVVNAVFCKREKNKWN